MKIYLAGKISGNDDYKEQFAELERRIYDIAEEYGREDITVLNPATLPEGMSRSEYMRICFQMIDISDCAFFLDGWIDSDGATLERDYCKYIGKTIYSELMGLVMIKASLRAVAEEDVFEVVSNALASCGEAVAEIMSEVSRRISEAFESIGGEDND